MFRLIRTAFCRTGALNSRIQVGQPAVLKSQRIVDQTTRQYTVLSPSTLQPVFNSTSLASNLKLSAPIQLNGLQVSDVPIRTVTKCSIRKGKRKTVRGVIRRFFRLHWGGWIRTRCGRHKKMHKKNANLKHRLRQHVLVNATQSQLLDKMVTKCWKRPKHYIDDLYEPYHTRSFYYARTEPMPYPDKPLPKQIPLAKISKLFE